MAPALFAYRPFAMGSVVAFIYGAALFGSTYLLPVFMQLGLSLSASHVGEEREEVVDHAAVGLSA